MLCFVAYLSRLGYAASTILGYISGVKYTVKIAGFNFDDSFILAKVLKGCKKGNSSPDVRIPITIQVLKSMCSNLWAVTNNSYEAVLFRAMFSVAFFGLCRVGEIASTDGLADHTILFHNVFSMPWGYSIALLSSKNNQCGPPQYISLRPNAIVCPVVALKAYLKARPPFKGKLFIHFDGSPVSDDNFRGVLHRTLEFLGVPSHNIKSHSFRIGGATYLHSLGYSDQFVREAGRWGENSTCYKRYIR